VKERVRRSGCECERRWRTPAGITSAIARSTAKSPLAAPNPTVCSWKQPVGSAAKAGAHAASVAPRNRSTSHTQLKGAAIYGMSGDQGW
jgi:hypothetical protein